MKFKLKMFILSLVSLALLTACDANSSNTQIYDETPVETQEIIEEIEETAQDDVINAQESDESLQNYTIYIGSNDIFTKHTVGLEPVDFSEVDATKFFLEALIDEMAQLTHWNLDCSVEAYKAVSVSFSEESSIFTGPPEPQVDEFFVFDAYSLAETILDSVKKTIQVNLVGELGDPDSVEVYYCTTNDEELILSDINMYVPLTEPYTKIQPIN